MRAFSRIIDRAKDLRGRMSPAEVRLWVRLRRSRAGGVTFRRQHPMGNYILDFYCPRAKLAVEIDGSSHEDERQATHDFQRTHWLERRGIVVMRVPARDVMRDADAVADAVFRFADELVAQRS